MRQLVAAQGRIASFRLTIASALGSFTPLFRRAGSIEVPLGPPQRAGVGQRDGAVLRSTVRVGRRQCCLTVIQMGRVQYAPRWL